MFSGPSQATGLCTQDAGLLTRNHPPYVKGTRLPQEWKGVHQSLQISFYDTCQGVPPTLLLTETHRLELCPFPC